MEVADSPGDLYFLALSGFQNVDENDELSYYQIAGTDNSFCPLRCISEYPSCAKMSDSGRVLKVYMGVRSVSGTTSKTFLVLQATWDIVLTGYVGTYPQSLLYVFYGQ